MPAGSVVLVRCHRVPAPHAPTTTGTVRLTATRQSEDLTFAALAHEMDRMEDIEDDVLLGLD